MSYTKESFRITLTSTLYTPCIRKYVYINMYKSYNWLIIYTYVSASVIRPQQIRSMHCVLLKEIFVNNKHKKLMRP